RHLQWLAPPLLRLGEYGLALWLGWRTGPVALGAVYAALAAIAFHHYDIVYRLRHQNMAPPRWVTRAGGGWDCRMVLLLAAALAQAFPPVTAAMAVWCAVLYVTDSVRSWAAVAVAEHREPATAGTAVRADDTRADDSREQD
nr:hypothetical protein [Euzebyales bacterium]